MTQKNRSVKNALFRALGFAVVFAVADAFVRDPAILRLTSTRLGPRQDNALGEGISKQEVEIEDFNKDSFLSDMESSLKELEVYQKELLDSLHKLTSTSSNKQRPTNKQDQIDRQCMPFQKLAQQAASLNAKYDEEIRQIRSRNPGIARANDLQQYKLAEPTKALASLGAISMCGLLVSKLATLPMDVTSIVEWPGFFSNTEVVEQVQPTSQEENLLEFSLDTPIASIPHSYKDFSKFEIYGSSTQVEEWFSM